LDHPQRRLNLLNNPVKVTFDTTGFFRLPKSKYFCTSDVVIIHNDSTKSIVPSETKDTWNYYSVLDLNDDGLNDLVYSGPCNPYYQTGVFINDGKELLLVYDFPGTIISIEKGNTGTTIHSLKEACCCDPDFDFTEIVVEKGSLFAKVNRITFRKIPLQDFKKLERIKVKGVLRHTPVVDDELKKDHCLDGMIEGNHWLTLDKETEVIRISQSGPWALVLYEQTKYQSIIGWMKSK
jgi:hypothetical protein